MSTPTIDHIGIVVEALEPAVAAMSRLLPGAALRRRSLPDAGLEVAEFQAANIVIELLEYTTREPGLARTTMGSVPGLNHISLSVPDLGAALAALAADGTRPMDGFPRRGAHGQIAFLNHDPRTGVLVELCQPDAGHSPNGPHDE